MKLKGISDKGFQRLAKKAQEDNGEGKNLDNAVDEIYGAIMSGVFNGAKSGLYHSLPYVVDKYELSENEKEFVVNEITNFLLTTDTTEIMTKLVGYLREEDIS